MQDRNFKGIWIPKDIRLSKDLSIQEKVLLVEIQSLNNSNWCFASNNYFAEFFWMTPKYVSKLINWLNDKWKISIMISPLDWNKRTIKTIEWTIPQKEDTYPTKVGYPILQKKDSNNTYNNNNKYTFDDFYNLYNKKINKVGASKSWARLTSSEKDIVMATLPRYLSTIKDKQYQPHPTTYLNQRRWEDEIQVSWLDYTNTDNFLKDIDYKYNDIKARFKSKFWEEEWLKQFFAKKKEANLLAFKKI